jgi:hypothetical protein
MTKEGTEILLPRPFKRQCNDNTCLKHWSAQVAEWVAGPVVTVPPTRLWVVFQGREPAVRNSFMYRSIPLCTLQFPVAL